MAKQISKTPGYATEVNISSNTLFHFTKRLESLDGILQNDFAPSYCTEIFSSKKRTVSMAVPMVSFCDLPLFLIKKHLNFYGCYGIGLTKTWGIKHGVTPVLYIHDISILDNVESWKNAIGLWDKATKIDSDKVKPDGKHLMLLIGQLEQTITNIQSITKFHLLLKQYEGKAWRKNEGIISKKRFYDEREWRYVPDTYGNNLPAYIKLPSLKDYDSSFEIELQNAAIGTLCKLTFTPDDIQFIIVKNDTEILDMVEILRKYKEKFGENSVTRLTTKIISSERIYQDL